MSAAEAFPGGGGEMIELNGLDYYVRDARSDGEPVLFLHGAPDHGGMWRHQYAAARAVGYRPICPDLLGYGRSERADDVERYRFDLMAADLVALLRHLSIEADSVHLVAHDFGASLGWILVGSKPQWFRSYCAMSVGHSSAFFGQLDLEHVRWQWNLFLDSHPDAISLFQANDGALFKAIAASHPDVDEVYEPFRDREACEALLNWERANHIPEAMAAAFAGQLSGELGPRVSVPTLGVWSDGDSFVWEKQMSESGEFVDAEWRYERLEGVGHWFMLERPEEANELMLSWLGRHGRTQIPAAHSAH